MFFAKKCQITIKNKNITLEAKSGTNLYKLLKDNGVNVTSLCDGNGQCGKCKVKISAPDGLEINKPTKKDRLILAPMNLENGYRLACEYIVKSDIIVDTEEWNISSSQDPNILGVKKINRNAPGVENGKAQDNSSTSEYVKSTDDTPSTDTQDNSVKDNFNTNAAPQKEASEGKSESTKKKAIEDPEYNLADGILLIQYPKGVKYYVYTAGINNISSEGMIETNEQLTDIIDNNTLSDFIYDNISIPDLERIIIILEKQFYEGEILFNLINYFTFDIGTVKCEIIQPYGDSKKLLTFLRLINTVNGQNLQVALDNLTYSYYLKEDTFYSLNSQYVTETVDLDFFLSSGKNPIIDISEDFNEITLKDNLFEPDSIALPALLKAIKLLIGIGAVDENFNLKSRKELVDDLKLEHLVKFSQRNDENLFYIYRKKDNEIFINQKMLNQLKELKIFLVSLTEYVQKELGTIENIIIQNLTHYDYLINNLFDLSILPKSYMKKTKFYSGDPTVLAAKFFTVRDIKTYIQSKIRDAREIALYKDENFNKIHDKIDKKITF